MLGKCTINALFIVPIIAVLLAIFGKNINLPPTIVWFQFIGMSFIGLIFYFLLYFFAAMGSFWLTTGRNAVFAMMVFSHLLNGSMVPLDLFPDWFMTFNTYSPFQFPIFIPIQAFLGRIDSWTPLLITAAVWIVIFIALIMILWRLGIKKYEAVGR
jgi:ABC-2 type transport system permease protein